MSKPYLWGKKFCHEKWEKEGLHISARNTTLCGIPMLGNNYADQTKDDANCPECLQKQEGIEYGIITIDEFLANDNKEKQLKHE
jgi:hypothetical protein